VERSNFAYVKEHLADCGLGAETLIINPVFTDAVMSCRYYVMVHQSFDRGLRMADMFAERIRRKGVLDPDAEKQKEQALQQIQGLIQQSQGNPQASQQLTMQLQQTQAMPVPVLHDVTVKRTKTDGKVCVENVPPEELLVSRYSKRIDDGFSAHRVLRTVSDLTAMGYKNVDMISSDNNDSSSTYNMEHVERVSYDDETPYIQEDSTNLDPTQRKVWLTECYLKADVDGDGISEWRKVVRAGDQILENVECDGPPFVSICPIPLPHRMFGLSIADLGMEPQRIQTSLLRAQLDNLYLSVNGRHFAVEGQVNLDDLLTSRPGGIVRVKAPDMVGPIDTPTQDSRGAMEMMEWFQDFTENSTGWTRYSQGSNSDSLNKTATGVNIITNKADQRLELISRQFAETGFTDLFKLMLKLTCQYQQKKKIIRLGDKWVDIDPREWRKGWGTQLVNFAKQLSPSGLELHTHQANVAARALYERHGFRAVKFGRSPAPESPSALQWPCPRIPRSNRYRNRYPGDPRRPCRHRRRSWRR